jgi:drug/metabolite transporter, DME family
MPAWITYSGLVILLWGAVGVLQKLGTNRVGSASLLIWLQAGYIALLPWLITCGGMSGLSTRDMIFGLLAGLTNGLGAWFLFASLESGAKASIATPITALSPMLTAILAVLLLGERLSPTQWLGSVLAVAAGVMLSYETPGSK